MGACDFSTYGSGKTLDEAYKNAVDAALYEHGHDSYNGTISTTDSVRIDSGAPRYGTKAFTKYLHKYYADTHNWDTEKWKTRAVELTGKALKEYRKRNGLERKRVKVFFFFGIAGC